MLSSLIKIELADLLLPVAAAARPGKPKEVSELVLAPLLLRTPFLALELLPTELTLLAVCL